MVKRTLLVVTNLWFNNINTVWNKPINIFTAFENKNGMLRYISVEEEKNCYFSTWWNFIMPDRLGETNLQTYKSQVIVKGIKALNNLKISIINK